MCEINSMREEITKQKVRSQTSNVILSNDPNLCQCGPIQSQSKSIIGM